MRVSSIIALIILPYFIYEDLTINNLPLFSIYFRLIPFLLAFIILLSVFSPLKKWNSYLRYLYLAFLFSAMVMMSGLVALSVSADSFDKYIMGTIVIIFTIYACSIFGSKQLLMIYAVPLLSLIVYLNIRGDVPFNRIMTLSNPIVTAVICTFLGGLINKIRFMEYLKSMTITEQNDQFQQELALARIIQSNLIPISIPRIKELEISLFFSPMIAIGGDFYDFVSFKEPHLFGVFISDVSGHGVSAALITSMVKTLINTSGPIREAPGRLLEYMNDKLIGQTNENFITAFYGIFDFNRKILRYARAGHNPPYLIRNGNIMELLGKGTFLGLFENLTFEEKEIPLEKNDKILLYTDGLTEAKGADGVEFGDVLVSLLAEYCQNTCKQCFSEICNRLAGFRNEEGFEDDISLILMELKQ